MSGGKKKSSFQITSVTTDYEGPGGSGGGDSLTALVSTLPTPRLPNGEPSSELGGKGTPRNGSPPPGAPASRFRVVKLPQGLGEPYRRGRWTCVDIYEKDLEAPGLSRLLEGVRGATGGTGGRSLDSRLELSSLGLVPPNPQPQGPTNWLRPPPTSPGLQARSFTGGLAQLAGGKGRAETPPLPASPPQQHPPEPSDGDSTGVLAPHASTQLPTLRVEAEVGAPAMTPPITRKKDGAPWLRKEGEERGQDTSSSRKSLDPFGASAQRLNLARSMLAIGSPLDGDDDSGSGSMVAIDNKIEQAMDLVKSHLMFAVREEVEVLKEQIRELAERNAALEQENELLRALASPEQLAQLPVSGTPHPGPLAPNGPSS
ncbi:TSC22 domain family protein 4 isoform X2 [Phascolarctos cinereus]|uniref:TSC22 domain family protein 4 isoform X2 n=1 Tax=Phascolarctos cinereus TaxID=38626 RepID=A0A6P5JKL6_PHACI|nr:TSC22 domain family protein 4 isoform X2 [Phascolarctos cinereus]